MSFFVHLYVVNRRRDKQGMSVDGQNFSAFHGLRSNDDTMRAAASWVGKFGVDIASYV